MNSANLHRLLGRNLFLAMTMLLFCPMAFGKLVLPKSLSSQDRQVVVETLGLSSTSKILGDPYPLGGYSGVEVGLTTEVMPTADLSRLGSRASQQSETSYTVISFGKGLYHNIDVFAQFNLRGNNENISNVGGQLRWGFFEAEYLPIFMSTVVSVASTNFQDLVIVSNQALDLVVGINVDDLTLYIGAGQIRAQGTFVGGSSGVTDSGNNAKENAEGSHYLAGLNLKFSKAFLALEIDRMQQSNYSAKLGFRF